MTRLTLIQASVSLICLFYTFVAVSSWLLFCFLQIWMLKQPQMKSLYATKGSFPVCVSDAVFSVNNDPLHSLLVLFLALLACVSSLSSCCWLFHLLLLQFFSLLSLSFLSHCYSLSVSCLRRNEVMMSRRRRKGRKGSVKTSPTKAVCD